MNWITKIIKAGEKIKTAIHKRASKDDIAKSDWTSCCKGPILKKDLEKNLWVCPEPECNKHHRIRPKQRFDILFGENNYEIFKTPIPNDDPLDWTDSKSYKDRLKAARKKTGLNCGMMVACGNINNIKITAVASDFDFLGASMASAEGEAFLYGIQHAIENQTPFICVSAGGGMRMMESLISLSQMTRTTLAINELKNNNLPYIVLITDPTAGGITASYAMLGDIHIAEPGSLIAFAGKRVIQGTVKEELPENFQTSEYVKKTGFVDLIVERKDLAEKIGTLLSILLKKNSAISSEENETSEDCQSLTKAAS
jgi:acetyl-CoA carboxylase carboxyl transferase subunit beta